MPKSDDKQLEVMSLSNVAKARFFHRSFPQYSITPLRTARQHGQIFGPQGLFVKDESFRFGLNAFKVLGGSFAMARTSPRRWADVSEMTYDYLTSEAFRDGVRPGYLLHRHRRQPRPRRGVGDQPPGPEGRRTYAQRAASPASTTSPPRARRLPLRRSTTTTACAWPPLKSHQAAASLCRTPPGTATRRSRLDHAGLRHHG